MLGGKHCEKRRNCSLQAISPFLTMFSLVRLHAAFCGNGLNKQNNFGLSKLKTFADDNKNWTKQSSFVFGKVENIVGKGENAAHQHFLPFPQYFQEHSYSVSLKVRIV